MKIDEQEFRSFIANLQDTLDRSTYSVNNNRRGEEDWNTYIRASNSVFISIQKYKEMLETPKPSKWKQLTIPI